MNVRMEKAIPDCCEQKTMEVVKDVLMRLGWQNEERSNVGG